MTARPHPADHRHPASSRTPWGRVALLRRAVAAGIATAAALAATVLLGASPAAAGGPTSVLIVNYDGSRASGALTGSTAYENLSRALDVMTEPTGDARPAHDFMSSQIRLTWMIHDVTPWRVDAVYLEGDDVWVSTTVSYESADLFSKAAVWHRPVDATLLLETLTSLGVVGAAPSISATPRASAATAPARPAQAAPTTPAATNTPAGLPWWLTLVAVVAALGLGFAGGRAGARTRAAGASPDDGRAPTGAGMPPASPQASAQGVGPAVRDGTDDRTRPAPVGFTPDEASSPR